MYMACDYMCFEQQPNKMTTRATTDPYNLTVLVAIPISTGGDACETPPRVVCVRNGAEGSKSVKRCFGMYCNISFDCNSAYLCVNVAGWQAGRHFLPTPYQRLIARPVSTAQCDGHAKETPAAEHGDNETTSVEDLEDAHLSETVQRLVKGLPLRVRHAALSILGHLGADTERPTHQRVRIQKDNMTYAVGPSRYGLFRPVLLQLLDYGVEADKPPTLDARRILHSLASSSLNADDIINPELRQIFQSMRRQATKASIDTDGGRPE